jgi:hypothetical protein
MPASTETQALLKRIFAESFVSMNYHNRPLLGLLHKVKGGSTVHEQPVIFGESAGRSRDPSIAQANKGRSQKAKILVPFGENYSTARISSLDAALAANQPKAAYADAVATEVDETSNQLANDAELGLIRAKAVRGKIAAINSAVITLEYRSDAKNFHPTQRLQISQVAGGALRNSGAVGTVLSVDEDTGTVTLTVAVTTAWAAAAVGDSIYQEGDAAAGGAEKGTFSLEDWLPITPPGGGDNFGGVDRSVSPTKLAGTRVDCRNLSAKEAMLKLVSRIGENEGEPDVSLVPFAYWERLALELGSNAETEVMGQGNAAQFGYRALKYVGPNANVMVIPHARMPGDRIYALTKKDWTLAIAGGGLDPIQNPLENGQVRDDGFGYSIEMQSILYLACKAPGHSGVGRIA